MVIVRIKSYVLASLLYYDKIVAMYFHVEHSRTHVSEVGAQQLKERRGFFLFYFIYIIFLALDDKIKKFFIIIFII